MKLKTFTQKKVDAFTLTELLVVLVIIGILILMALPVLMPLISKTRSLEAKQALKHLQSLEKSYYYEHSKYSNNLEEVGFEQEALVSEGGSGKANYRVEIVEAGATNYLLRATAVVDFDGDGQFNIWEADQDQNLKETVKD